LQRSRVDLLAGRTRAESKGTGFRITVHRLLGQVPLEGLLNLKKRDSSTGGRGGVKRRDAGERPLLFWGLPVQPKKGKGKPCSKAFGGNCIILT